MFGFFLGGMLLLSAFSTSNLPPFLLGPLCCAEWRRTFCAKSSNFSNWKATILLYMLVQCLWGQTNIQVCHLEMAQWFAIGTAQNLICVCRVLLCGCEEEHPPLHQRRCLDLVLTSYNCQSLSRAFQVPSSHLPLLLHRPLRHRQCESKCNVFWLPWNSHQQARLERPNPLARPQLNQASHCFCLLFIRVRLTRRMSTARFHIAAGVAHVKNWAAAHLSYSSKPISIVEFLIQLDSHKVTFWFTFCQEGFKLWRVGFWLWTWWRLVRFLTTSLHSCGSGKSLASSGKSDGWWNILIWPDFRYLSLIYMLDGWYKARGLIGTSVQCWYLFFLWYENARDGGFRQSSLGNNAT